VADVVVCVYDLRVCEDKDFCIRVRATVWAECETARRVDCRDLAFNGDFHLRRRCVGRCGNDLVDIFCTGCAGVIGCGNLCDFINVDIQYESVQLPGNDVERDGCRYAQFFSIIRFKTIACSAMRLASVCIVGADT